MPRESKPKAQLERLQFTAPDGVLRYKFLAEFGMIRRNNGATSSGRYIAATFPRGEGSGSAARQRVFPHTSLSEAKAERLPAAAAGDRKSAASR